jgi:hypothetical protein
MARTISEILTEASAAQERLNELYTVITNEVAADVNLAGLTSPSKTAEFNLWKYVKSALSYIQEAIWDEAKDEMQTIVDSAIPGTEKWMQKEIKKFQYGDALSFDTVTAKYFYAIIDATKQIVKRCALNSAGGLTTIKVATEDGSGNPIALDALQLNALRSYVDQIKWAGSNTQVVSFDSDKLNAPITIYYNGTILLSDLKPLIEAAFNNYLANLPFNGEYNITKHQDSLQAVPNVIDVVMGNIQAKADSGSYGSVIRVYYPASGYIEKDPAITFDTMITYVPL